MRVLELRALEESDEAGGGGERAYIAMTAREFLEGQVLDQTD